MVSESIASELRDYAAALRKQAEYDAARLADMESEKDRLREKVAQGNAAADEYDEAAELLEKVPAGSADTEVK